MLLALVSILFVLLVLSLSIIYILELGIGALSEYIKENDLERPSRDELKRLIEQWMERRPAMKSQA